MRFLASKVPLCTRKIAYVYRGRGTSRIRKCVCRCTRKCRTRASGLRTPGAPPPPSNNIRRSILPPLEMSTLSNRWFPHERQLLSECGEGGRRRILSALGCHALLPHESEVLLPPKIKLGTYTLAGVRGSAGPELLALARRGRRASRRTVSVGAPPPI